VPIAVPSCTGKQCAAAKGKAKGRVRDRNNATQQPHDAAGRCASFRGVYNIAAVQQIWLRYGLKANIPVGDYV
jgi:hypothetical protein